MKQLVYLFAAVLCLSASCKKNEITAGSLVTLSVVNAVIEGKVARLNDHLRDSCLNMGYKHFNIVGGGASIIKVYPSGAPAMPYYIQNPDTRAGDLYSLFLTGTHTTPEAIWVKDDIPPYPAEEVINVRLVNLAPGSVPISLNLGDAPSVTIFSGIAYKQVSEFKTLSFPMNLPANRNLFQISDGFGNIMFTYTMPDFGTVSTNASRRRNITVAFKGQTGGTGANAPGVVVLPHY